MAFGDEDRVGIGRRCPLAAGLEPGVERFVTARLLASGMVAHQVAHDAEEPWFDGLPFVEAVERPKEPHDAVLRDVLGGLGAPGELEGEDIGAVAGLLGKRFTRLGLSFSRSRYERALRCRRRGPHDAHDGTPHASTYA